MNIYGADRVTLDLSREEFNSIILALGYAAASATQQNDGNGKNFNAWLRVANAINLGNPDWTPYEVPEKEKGTES